MGRALAFSCFDAFAANSYKIPRYHMVAALYRINMTESTDSLLPLFFREYSDKDDLRDIVPKRSSSQHAMRS
jgi:hypothetical protein